MKSDILLLLLDDKTYTWIIFVGAETKNSEEYGNSKMKKF